MARVGAGGPSCGYPSAFAGFDARGARARAEMAAVSNMRTADEWRAMLSDAGFTSTEVREERTRRAWYPRVPEIRAVAGQAVPGSQNHIVSP